MEFVMIFTAVRRWVDYFDCVDCRYLGDKAGREENLSADLCRPLSEKVLKRKSEG